MLLTENALRNIIKEEYKKLIKEADGGRDEIGHFAGPGDAYKHKITQSDIQAANLDWNAMVLDITHAFRQGQEPDINKYKSKMNNIKRTLRSLTPETIRNIHHYGGNIIKATKQDEPELKEKVIDFISSLF